MVNSESKTKLLLVEDDPNDVAVALRAFRRHHLDEVVEVIGNGADALEYLRDAGRGKKPLPQVIFLDLRMPDIDGIDVLRQMRSSAATKFLPVVMISSSKRQSDIEASYRSGVNSFVVKRFEPRRPGEYLVDIARYWLELNEGPE